MPLFFTLPIVGTLLSDAPTLNDVANDADRGFFRTVVLCGDRPDCVDSYPSELDQGLERSAGDVAAVVAACDGALAKVKDTKRITLGNFLNQTKGSMCTAAREYEARGLRVLTATYRKYQTDICTGRGEIGASLGTATETRWSYDAGMMTRLLDTTGASLVDAWQPRFQRFGAELPATEACLAETSASAVAAWGAVQPSGTLATGTIDERAKAVARDLGFTPLAVYAEPWEVKTYSDGSIDDRRAKVLVLRRVEGEPHCRAHLGTVIQEYIGSGYIEGGEAAIVERDRFVLRACP